MNKQPKTPNPLTRTLTASAVAMALAFGSATGYAADGQQAQSGKPATGQQTPAAKPAPTEQTLTERETVATYAGWEDPNMARVAVFGGRALLRHIEAAHEALQENKIGEARKALDAADDFAKGLQLMMPYTVVVDNVRNAQHKLLASSQGVIVDDLLPIYANLDEMADFAPKVAHKAKGKLNEVLQYLHLEKRKQAAEKLQEVAADISESTVYLPVLYVEGQLKASLAALAKDPADTKTAKTAVDNAMDSLVESTIAAYFAPEKHAAAKAKSSGKDDAGAKSH